MLLTIIAIVAFLLIGFYFYGAAEYNKSRPPLSLKYNTLVENIILEFYSNGNILHDENNKLVLGVINDGTSMLFTLKETPDGFLDITFNIKGSPIITNTEKRFSFKQDTCINNYTSVIQKLKFNLDTLS